MQERPALSGLFLFLENRMSNMSYCRFQNTRADFSDCKDAIEGLVNGQEASLSHEELRAAKELAVEAFKFLQFIFDGVNLVWDGLDEDRIERAVEFINTLAEKQERE
jgi:hypothetical protein